jgi:ribosome-associated heat shock protein Hsp15
MMNVKGAVRIDKYLWAVRIFKTRSIAANACRMGRILIDNMPVKPSRIIEAGTMLTVKKPPAAYTFRVNEPVENRVSAKLVSRYIEDLTPDDERHKLEIQKQGPALFRQKGTGRPTKKERRLIDKWKDEVNE